jgi:hypothetical protein
MRIAPPSPRFTRAALKEDVSCVEHACGRDAASAREEAGTERCGTECVRLLDELAHGPAFVRSCQDVGQLRTRLHKDLSQLLAVHSHPPFCVQLLGATKFEQPPSAVLEQPMDLQVLLPAAAGALHRQQHVAGRGGCRCGGAGQKGAFAGCRTCLKLCSASRGRSTACSWATSTPVSS